LRDLSPMSRTTTATRPVRPGKPNGSSRTTTATRPVRPGKPNGSSRTTTAARPVRLPYRNRLGSGSDTARGAEVNCPRQPVQAPDSPESSGRAQTIEPGDPLVRALAVCIRQAHARRLARRTG
jgi:hypothetical protein